MEEKAIHFEEIARERTGWKKILPFLGPAFIAAVAYIDPGNFATNITAGSKYGYMLLWVILLSNLIALLIQSMSAKLGIATGKNLPEIARENFPTPVNYFLWIQGEIVIIATDLAEFIGAALGLNLIFGISLFWAALITAIVSFGILELQRRGFRWLEIGIASLVSLIVLAFAVQIFYTEPDANHVVKGLFMPRIEGVDSILLAAGIIGATVMPHAIFLHSSLTKSRIVGDTKKELKQIFKFEFLDILIAMLIAGLINMCMLIVAAALFHSKGLHVDDLQVAYYQFDKLIGPSSAFFFGGALLIAGLSSSSVGTLSGDVIMQGFVQKSIPIYFRRVITVIPPLCIIGFGVNASDALVLSQVVLSFGIAFAIVPLILFTSKKELMGELVNRTITKTLAWIIAVLVVGLNLLLLYRLIF